MKLNDDKLKLRRGTRIGADSPLLGLPKGSLQVCLERDCKCVKGKTKAGKPRYVRHHCPFVKKTEEELFEDEMLRAMGREDEINPKIHHKGYDDH